MDIRKIKNYLIEKVIVLLLALFGIMVMKGCTFFFHEEELSDNLKKSNPFFPEIKD